ncbi:hypothetical protein AFERRI_370065 [Acidithiobacillus ferrivorans]|uniref:Transposase n=1 Tax=Acidithiobacillus ferrivorans TaxID=160808 RepID=A0A060UNW9_9PROT|nr:IS66 family insertion sequence element accessory protein TnpB [Acidithiobacillus sp. MC6.1]CDQ09961.1 hypothetical protein AFERRI_370065 [Acidithiobacillus ferrivorans]
MSPSSRIWLAAAPVDMRLGFDGLAAKVQGVLAAADPFCGHVFVFPTATAKAEWAEEHAAWNIVP